MTRISDVATELLGPRLAADTGEWGTYAWTEHLLGAPGYRIAGGTDEIQRNVIAERVLGLPGRTARRQGCPVLPAQPHVAPLVLSPPELPVHPRRPVRQAAPGEEQTATTNEMTRALSAVAQGSEEIAQNIGSVARESHATTERMVAGQDTAATLTRMADELNAVVGRFAY